MLQFEYKVPFCFWKYSWRIDEFKVIVLLFHLLNIKLIPKGEPIDLRIFMSIFAKTLWPHYKCSIYKQIVIYRETEMQKIYNSMN